jgi:hypothetical protein
MPESFWTDRAIMLLEDFTDHNLIRKHLSPTVLAALDAEHQRLCDLCFEQQKQERR